MEYTSTEGKTRVNFQVGDKVEQWCFGVRESARFVTVTAKHNNVKNGRAGFDGYTDDGASVWGYNEDVHAIISKAVR